MTAPDSPAARGEVARRGLTDSVYDRFGQGGPGVLKIPADCWRESWHAALTTVGTLAALVAAWCAFLGLAALTRPLGVLLLHLASGSH